MEISTRVNGKPARCMEKESIITLMAVYMKVTFRMESDEAKEYQSDQMVIATKENGKMT